MRTHLFKNKSISCSWIRHHVRHVCPYSLSGNKRENSSRSFYASYVKKPQGIECTSKHAAGDSLLHSTVFYSYSLRVFGPIVLIQSMLIYRSH